MVLTPAGPSALIIGAAGLVYLIALFGVLRLWQFLKYEPPKPRTPEMLEPLFTYARARLGPQTKIDVQLRPAEEAYQVTFRRGDLEFSDLVSSSDMEDRPNVAFRDLVDVACEAFTRAGEAEVHGASE